MNISKNNWMTWVIRSSLFWSNNIAFDREVPDIWDESKMRTFEGNMPKNLCAFWWTFIGCFILQIPNWPVLFALPFSKKLRNDPGKFDPEESITYLFGSWIISLAAHLLALIPMKVFTLFANIEMVDLFTTWHILWIYPVAILVTLICVALIIGVIFVLVFLYNIITAVSKALYRMIIPEKEIICPIKEEDYEKYNEYHKACNEWWDEYNRIAQDKYEQTFRYIVGQWFKSKKEKVCPMIEYKD